jgi:hypothetical protein
MPGIALDSASKGRLRPSFFFLLGVAAASAMAQQTVYRCGQEYTNAPRDPERCERVNAPAVTVIAGTRVQGGRPAAQVPAVPAAAASGVAQQQRDDMARNIVSAELEQARQRHALLLQEYRQGEPVRTSEEMQNPQKYQDRMARLKAAVDRSQRDLDSLQRELARRPLASANP